MVSIKDVAAASGVTVTTVSRVLNNRGYISKATRNKVYEAMKQLDYQPNEVARALYKKKSNMLGLIIPNVSHPFFAELTKYIEFFAYEKGYKLLLCNSYRESDKEQGYIDMLKRHKVDGIIMGSHSLEIASYQNLDLPIIAIDRNLSEEIPFVTSDNYRGGILATQLLIEKGCKKLAHISGPLTLNTPANKRCEGFLKVVKEKGVQYLVVETALGGLDGTQYREVVKKLFAEHPDIDGVFASSDLIAAELINVVATMGKQIPSDIKVVGYDDVYVSSIIRPALTTIKQPIEAMGKLLVDLIIQKIDNKNIMIENMLPVQLIERQST